MTTVVNLARNTSLLSVAAVIVAAFSLTPGASAGSNVPDSAVKEAKRYVKEHFNLSKIEGSTSIVRSHRDRKWAGIAGTYPKKGTSGLWAVWLKLTNGRWRVKHAGIDDDIIGTNFKDVPCDIEPAFSEPYC